MALNVAIGLLGLLGLGLAGVLVAFIAFIVNGFCTVMVATVCL